MSLKDDADAGAPKRRYPKQADTINPLACNSIPIRSFHITWITFFCCFLAWFCTTNIFVAISSDFNLTLTQHQLAGSLSITSTIIFRPIIAYLCPKFGSRISYIIVLLCTILSLIILSVVYTSIGYIICHIFLGIAGASFVVSQYHTTRLFAGKIVGRAQAITAGMGNVGGGVANFIIPLLVYQCNISWRWILLFVAGILFILCFIYYFGSSDTAKPDTNLSFSLINLNNSRSLRGQFGNSKPRDKIHIGGFFKDAFYDYRAWVLFACYAASCGVEITFYLVGAHYFSIEFDLSEIMSGLIIMCWSSINLFARPGGGYLCDKYSIPKRGKIIFYILFLESILIIIFGAIGHKSLIASIIVSMLFSMCIQMAEGAIFSIVAFIQPKSIGHVIGIVGSGANVGAAFFIFVIFLPLEISNYEVQYSWVILGVVVMICSFCALMIQFTNRELHDSNQNMAAVYDLDAVQTVQTIDTKNLR
eukprot:506723_1